MKEMLIVVGMFLTTYSSHKKKASSLLSKGNVVSSLIVGSLIFVVALGACVTPRN